MNYPQDPMEHIAELLETKACVKQQTYRNLQKVFRALKTEAQKVIDQVNQKTGQKDKEVTLAVIDVSHEEFHLKIAGDLLVFLLHTNIIKLGEEHGSNKSQYISDNTMRRYFGQINVYNFMADSLKFNRLSDPGYLIARLFVNFEKHFLIEGDGQLNYMVENISEKPLHATDISIFIQLVISQAIDTDLVTAPFSSLRTITLHQKIEQSQALGGGYKIGFQMSRQI